MARGPQPSRPSPIHPDIRPPPGAVDYASRLPGEPLAGIGDIDAHPSLPRTVRVSLMPGF